MIIEQIIALSGIKYKVIFDEGDSCILYLKEMKLLGLEEGKEISDEQYRMILEDIVLKRAKKKALDLLKAQDRTEFQLHQKLEQSGYAQDIITAAIDYVKQYHYIDDERYAQYYLEHNISRKSKRQIAFELSRKGIDRAIQSDILDQIEAEDEIKAIQKWIEKKRFQADNATVEEKRKMYQFLLGKGFGMELVSKVINTNYDY